MKLKQLFILLLLINIFALIFVVMTISEYQKATKELELSYKQQHRSLVLADELRQSSDDLTRMARTYVITANERFKKQFQKVLDIRNGVLPRPKNYNHIYWDFKTLVDEDNNSFEEGEKISLRELMKQAGFPEIELQLLYQSAKESDDLTSLETKAMNAVKGIFQDKNGEYTVYGRPDLEYAGSIMHSNEYHEAKIAIMKPLNQFYIAFEKRTQEKVNIAHERVKQLENAVAIAIFVLILLVLLSFFILLTRIMYPIESLKNTMLRLSKNDMDTKIPEHLNDDEVGDMIGSVEIFKKNALQLIHNEESLKQAIKEANIANHAKSVFLANMSHELRTPLNAILGFTKILEKSKNINIQEKDNLKTIKNSGNHLLTIINEILEFSKLEAGKIKIENNDFNLYKTINEIKEMFDIRFEKKNLDFAIEIDKNVPQYINGDELRIRQIIINILGNSLKFTKKGSVALKIYLQYNQIYFTIKDTGIGIEKSELKHIFKPFEQSKEQKHSKQGTGLGLSISKELSKMMQGDIRVWSEKNVGSEFLFYIRYTKATMINDMVEIEEKIEKNITYENKTVLVVDDIEENRLLLVQLLQQYNIKTIEAKDGNEVMDILSANKIDLIFMDISMPILNGYETTSLIRKNSLYMLTPIVIVSANIFKEDEEKAYEVGANGFLQKPIDEDKLALYLNRYLYFECVEMKTLETEIKNKIIEYAKELDATSIEKIIEESTINKEIENKILSYLDDYDFNGLIAYLK
jgi:signal transduction histidine kinase/CheY-like chemotaxis protein